MEHLLAKHLTWFNIFVIHVLWKSFHLWLFVLWKNVVVFCQQYVIKEDFFFMLTDDIYSRVLGWQNYVRLLYGKEFMFTIALVFHSTSGKGLIPFAFDCSVWCVNLTIQIIKASKMHILTQIQKHLKHGLLNWSICIIYSQATRYWFTK